MPNECQHGQLKRQCPLCEMDEDIKFLKTENQMLRDTIDSHTRTIVELQAKSIQDMTDLICKITESLKDC